MTRQEPPPDADERAVLTTFLDYHRETLRMKVDGLDAAQLQQTLPPSDMTLGGLVKHLALVEHAWANRMTNEAYADPWAAVDWAADPDWEWRTAAADPLPDLLALLAVEVARADAIYAARDLGAVALRPDRRTGNRVSVRWILVHLIEEYARHNGHADLIRQSIDGAVGE